MDIFYHSQSFEQNVKNGSVGLIGSSSTKIVELSQRLPKLVWVFKTPKGMKGSIQLVASLLISEEPSVAVQTDQPHVIYYDAFSPQSVIYTKTGTPDRIDEVSRHFQYRWRTAFSTSFRGDAGLQAMEADVVRGLQAMVTEWETVQMLERVKDRDSVRPINPFAQPR
ncbi:hypothetical protein AWB78_03995 [Caballeronia calidae]|uniref:Uncharacterized protein n=1 Tax=Caballeronia calidae TaxID=1777139 RepID=A0A158CIS9_9BURK|nr:hypothetical protein [Caballeronia calidae]SAK82182.1 hypothetical protein AWB78_03995 [Caballeronia calidae]